MVAILEPRKTFLWSTARSISLRGHLRIHNGIDLLALQSRLWQKFWLIDEHKSIIQASYPPPASFDHNSGNFLSVCTRDQTGTIRIRINRVRFLFSRP